MTQAEVRNRLELKLAVLEKIRLNTETQGRFIRKREMRGLNRLLRERAALITELEAVNRELESQSDWRTMGELNSLIDAVDAKERETRDFAGKVMREAVAEREQIGSELKNIRLRRQAARKYALPQSALSRFGRLNVKG